MFQSFGAFLQEQNNLRIWGNYINYIMRKIANLLS